MMPRRFQKSYWPLPAALALAGLLAFTQAAADSLKIAVASNFSAAMKDLAARFEDSRGHQVTLIFGSTGKHYAQILNGAPYDAFFAADMERPRLLEDQALAIAGSRFCYARGKLVLWSPDPDRVDSEGRVLKQGTFRHLALANPRLAPYGRAAEQVLRARGLWDELQPRLVRGENIAQAFQFVGSGNAELGFVAFSQISSGDRAGTGSYWDIPETLYSPIEQHAVLLDDSDAARDFMGFVQSAEARAVIRHHGYGSP